MAIVVRHAAVTSSQRVGVRQTRRSEDSFFEEHLGPALLMGGIALTLIFVVAPIFLVRAAISVIK